MCNVGYLTANDNAIRNFNRHFRAVTCLFNIRCRFSLRSAEVYRIIGTLLLLPTPSGRLVVRMTSFISHTRHTHAFASVLHARGGRSSWRLHEFLFFVNEVAWVKEGFSEGRRAEAEIVELLHRTHYRYCFAHTQEAGTKRRCEISFPTLFFPRQPDKPARKYSSSCRKYRLILCRATLVPLRIQISRRSHSGENFKSSIFELYEHSNWIQIFLFIFCC